MQLHLFLAHKVEARIDIYYINSFIIILFCWGTSMGLLCLWSIVSRPDPAGDITIYYLHCYSAQRPTLRTIILYVCVHTHMNMHVYICVFTCMRTHTPTHPHFLGENYKVFSQSERDGLRQVPEVREWGSTI